MKHPTRRSILVVASLVITTGLVTVVHGADAQAGCTRTWSATAVDTNWNSAVNWVPAGVPGASDDACVPAGTVVVTGSVPGVRTLALGGPAGASIATLTGTVRFSGSAEINETGRLVIDVTDAGSPSFGTVGHTFTNYGTVEVTSHVSSGLEFLRGVNFVGPIRNVGTLKVSGQAGSGWQGFLDPLTLRNEGSILVTGTGWISLAAGSELQVAGGTITNNGKFQVLETLRLGAGAVAGSPGNPIEVGGNVFYDVGSASGESHLSAGAFGTLPLLKSANGGLISAASSVVINGTTEANQRTLFVATDLTNRGKISLTCSATPSTCQTQLLMTVGQTLTTTTLTNEGTLELLAGTGNAAKLSGVVENAAAGTITVGAATINGSGGEYTVRNFGTVTVGDAASLKVTGRLEALGGTLATNGSGYYELRGSGSTFVSGNGTTSATTPIRMTGGNGLTTIDYTGTGATHIALADGSPVAAKGTIPVGASLDVGPSKTLQFAGPLTNAGLMTLGSGSTFNLNGFNFDNSGTFETRTAESGPGSTVLPILSGGGNVANSGTMTLNASMRHIGAGPTPLINTGTISVARPWRLTNFDYLASAPALLDITVDVSYTSGLVDSGHVGGCLRINDAVQRVPGVTNFDNIIARRAGGASISGTFDPSCITFNTQPYRLSYEPGYIAIAAIDPTSTDIGSGALAPAPIGQPVTVTAVVTPAHATSPTVTGTVQLQSDGVDVAGATATLSTPPGTAANSRTAILTTSALPVGTHALTVRYVDPAASPLFGPSTSSARSVTINNPLAATVSIAGGSRLEGDSGSALLPFTVTLSEALPDAITVSVRTLTTGTATPGTDYTALASTAATFAAGDTSKTVNVSMIGDTDVERHETVVAELSATSLPVGVTIAAQSTATGTITDDDTATVSVADVSAVEGTGGSGFHYLQLPVALSAAVPWPVSVELTVSDGTALAGSDYEALAPTTVTFASGETSKTVPLRLFSDQVVENSETLTFRITTLDLGPRGVSIGIAQALGTIVNDDTVSAVVSIADAGVDEGQSASTPMVFTLSLSSPMPGPVTVVASTMTGGTATAGTDYSALASTPVTFAAGETTKTVTVNVTGDVIVEPDETVRLELAAPTGGLSAGVTLNAAQSIATGTIRNDDNATLSVLDAGQFPEGNPGSGRGLIWNVKLSAPVAQPVTVYLTSSDGTAIAGTDYNPVEPNPTTITFAPGASLSRVVTLGTIIGDLLVEPNETVLATLTGPSAGLPSGVTIADAVATYTIGNDDITRISIADASLAEGNSDVSSMSFPLTLSAPASFPISVEVHDEGSGTATAGTDYPTFGPSTVTFAPGSLSATFQVPVVGDTVFEADETIEVVVAIAAGPPVYLIRSGATGTIINDESPGPTATIDQGSARLTRRRYRRFCSMSCSHNPSPGSTTAT